MMGATDPIVIPDIPESHHEALAWLENFHARLSLRPPAFGADGRDVASLAAHIANFRDALRASRPDADLQGPPPSASIDLAPGSHQRTELILARNAAVASAGIIIRMIKANPLVDEHDLHLLGLLPRTPGQR